jgi:hypothetical protein
MTVGTCLASLLRDVCMQWTIEANGPHGEDDEDRDHRPTDWNIHFFDFLGVLAVNLSNEQLVSMFLEPMSRFRDEPFYDAIGAFLRGFDRATVATDTRDPENPAAVRSLVADRIRRGWGFKRLTREKIWSAETHLGDALNALFYQPSNWANRNQQPHIARRWDGFNTARPPEAFGYPVDRGMYIPIERDEALREACAGLISKTLPTTCTRKAP